MPLLLTIVVCLFAGAGAGLGTGFAGMSAAAVTTRSCSSAVPFSFQQTICRSIVFTPPAPRTAELYSCSFYRDMLKKSIVKLDFC